MKRSEIRFLQDLGIPPINLDKFMMALRYHTNYVCETTYTFSFYTNLYHTLENFRSSYPERYKRIKAACDLEEFDSMWEIATFLAKLIESTASRQTRIV